MRSLVAVTLALLMGTSGLASAREHLVPLEHLDAHLAEAALARRADRARVESVLALPEAERMARSFGVEPETLRRAVARLDDAELHDLALRAVVLRQDPVAGSSRKSTAGKVENVLVKVALGVLLAYVVVLLLLDEYAKGW